MNQFWDLSSKVIVVTGGNSGLGKGIVNALECAGATAITVGRSVEESEEVGLKTRYRCDVSNLEEVNILFEKIYSGHKSIDGLVNCAGVYLDTPLNTKGFYSNWKSLVDINLTGSAICANSVAQYMKEQGRGKIINFGSAYSEFGHHKSIAYTATKTGVIGLTRALSAELGRWNICVNVVLPGWFDTKMNQGVPNSPRGEFIQNVTPLQRWGNASDLAGIIILLCSHGSDFITGAEIRVDGGYAISDRDYRHV